MTTSPISIADNAFVISTLAYGTNIGTLNIKGGDPENKAWAEFIPQSHLDYFSSPAAEARLDTLLTESFTGYTLEQIKSDDFTSKPKMSIFDINLPNHICPYIEITGTTIHISNYENTYTLTLEDDIYVCNEANTWLNALLEDLNMPPDNDSKRAFFLERGYMLLNYIHNVQNDTSDFGDSISFAEIYESSSQTKVPSVQI